MWQNCLFQKRLNEIFLTFIKNIELSITNQTFGFYEIDMCQTAYQLQPAFPKTFDGISSDEAIDIIWWEIGFEHSE